MCLVLLCEIFCASLSEKGCFATEETADLILNYENGDCRYMRIIITWYYLGKFSRREAFQTVWVKVVQMMRAYACLIAPTNLPYDLYFVPHSLQLSYITGLSTFRKKTITTITQHFNNINQSTPKNLWLAPPCLETQASLSDFVQNFFLDVVLWQHEIRVFCNSIFPLFILI